MQVALPVILAHGALGNFDELIFIGVAVVFLGMMGLSWWRSREFEPELDDEVTHTSPTPESGTGSAGASSPPAPDHIRLQ